MIVAVGLLGPLPRFDYPLQAANTPETCQTSMMCCQKSSQIVFDRSWNCRPVQSKYQCAIMIWGTVFTNGCCSICGTDGYGMIVSPDDTGVQVLNVPIESIKNLNREHRTIIRIKTKHIPLHVWLMWFLSHYLLSKQKERPLQETAWFNILF